MPYYYKVRKVPLYEAVQWTGENSRQMFDFLTGTKDQTITTRGKFFEIDFCNGACATGDLIIYEPTKSVRCSRGDYIVRVGYSFMVVPANQFEDNYAFVRE